MYAWALTPYSLLVPAVINCLGSQFPTKWDSWLTIKFFLLGVEDLSLDSIPVSVNTLKTVDKASDASCFSAFLKVTHPEMNVTVLHLLIRRLPTGHLEVPWLHSHFQKKYSYIIKIFKAIFKIHFYNLNHIRDIHAYWT